MSSPNISAGSKELGGCENGRQRPLWEVVLNFDINETEIGSRIVTTIRELKRQSCLVDRLRKRCRDIAFSLKQFGEVLDGNAHSIQENKDGSILVKWKPNSVRPQILPPFPDSRESAELYNEFQNQAKRLEELKTEHEELTRLAEGIPGDSSPLG